MKLRAIRPRWYVLAVVVVIVAALGVMDAVMSARGCGSIDPTDANNYSEVVIVNDTAKRVTVSDCRGAYCVSEPARQLRPGQSHIFQAACAATGGDMTSWRVSDSSGPLGFIAVNTPKKHDGLIFPVSHASTSRTTPTPFDAP